MLCRLPLPRDVLGVVLTGVGWITFGYSMALKTVTLVTATGSSGEAEKIPPTAAGRPVSERSPSASAS